MVSAKETDMYEAILETNDGSSSDAGWYFPYPLGFQVSLTSFLMLEIVLGFSSNLTVLVLYCMQSNLVDSVSNMVTMNLHVLDIIICVICVPLTIVIILIPLEQNIALVCCFHEACVTFSSIATAINVLVISLDRYDISVRPANRVLTPSRMVLLLSCVWFVSLMVFFIPFFEVEFFGDPDHMATWQNRTLLCVSVNEYHTELGMYYHLVIQIPIFFAAVAVMLVTYTKILQALNIKIGNHFKRSQRRKTKKRKKKEIIRPKHHGGDQKTGPSNGDTEPSFEGPSFCFCHYCLETGSKTSSGPPRTPKACLQDVSNYHHNLFTMLGSNFYCEPSYPLSGAQ